MAITSTALRLKTMLGTEIPGAWIMFMDEVKETIPFLFSKGRPSAQQIADSEIGEAGCSSWREYVETVLEWNYSAWSAWNRAYNVVQKFPYLRELELTSSQINTLYNQLKDDFPASKEAFLELQKKAVEEKEKLDLEKNSTLQAKVKDLQGQLAQLQTDLLAEREKNLAAGQEALSKDAEIARLNTELEAINERHKSAGQAIETAYQERDKAVKALKEAKERFQKTPWFKKPFFVF